jgi:hypothetical protein
MKLWEILIPVCDNSGKRFAARHHATFEEMVRTMAGGLTKCAPVEGQWVDGKTLYREKMQPVRIATTARNIKKLALLAKAHYRQLAVMYYPLSEGAVFC